MRCTSMHVAGGVSQVMFARDTRTLVALRAAGTLSFLFIDRSLDYRQDTADGEFRCAPSADADADGDGA
ncbi:hypothetical protein [Burkholderia sp. PU8-34]